MPRPARSSNSSAESLMPLPALSARLTLRSRLTRSWGAVMSEVPRRKVAVLPQIALGADELAALDPFRLPRFG